jgi:nicotinate (nicotinamide) nucleotide adenylyltransferase
MFLDGTKRIMDVGIIGGAFDPVTKGHIELANFALLKGGFDEIWLMPCYKHMHNKSMASAEHRLAMCNLATKPYPNITVSSYEIDNKMEMSTYGVMFNLLQDESEWAKYYKFRMVIGLDNANNFEKWVNWECLKELINFTVIARKGVNRDVTKTWYLNEGHFYLSENNEIPNTSSSSVRELFKEDDANIYGSSYDIKRQICRSVFNYIMKHKLYKM